MQSYQLVYQIRAFAVLAEMEAMKAENEKRSQAGEAQFYSGGSFLELANRLENLAILAAQC